MNQKNNKYNDTLKIEKINFGYVSIKPLDEQTYNVAAPLSRGRFYILVVFLVVLCFSCRRTDRSEQCLLINASRWVVGWLVVMGSEE